MTSPSRRCSWRAISVNYSSASFRKLSFRHCHDTSPPATQTFWYEQMHELSMSCVFYLFHCIWLLCLWRLKHLCTLWSATETTLWKILVLFCCQTRSVCRHVRNNNEEFKRWLRGTEGDGSISCLRWNFLCFKKPLMQPMTHFHCYWILWVLAVCCVHAQAFLWRFQSCKRAVIISSSQSLRQNEDTVILYLNKWDDVCKKKKESFSSL